MLLPHVKAFHHEPSGTFSYVVRDPSSQSAAIIDPVADFEYRAGRISHGSATEILDYCRSNQLEVEWILETHAHADHISDAPWLAAQLGAVPIAIGAGITEVQARFKQVFNLPDTFRIDGSQFNHLFATGERFSIGALEGHVIATPGHTSDSNAFLIGDAVFVGDTLFAPDYGTARCDFPGGDAGVLFDSIQKLYELPDATRVFLCHDYPPEHRGPVFETTIGEQKRHNKHVRADTARADFVEMRNERDASLPLPDLIIPSVQVNINTGNPLPAEANGTHYIKVPLNIFPGDPGGHEKGGQG
jgi:glyoxylase-like metal-dependent hydrolase (beta-lactamase superfamily II)